MRFNGEENLDGNSYINLQSDNLEIMNTFKYIGATLANNVDLVATMTNIIQSGWKQTGGGNGGLV